MQLARQRMLERIRELEQQRVYAIYKDKVGTVITGQPILQGSPTFPMLTGRLRGGRLPVAL
jgi:hypothetical protein